MKEASEKQKKARQIFKNAVEHAKNLKGEEKKLAIQHYMKKHYHAK